ncbi:hypothetical protein ACSTS3_08050 [Aquimarina muelleri]|uniref:hypothetical protein n=1 Tax=Aquimarina muelleri TaxID=279356 RepID=UPI003F687367
MQKDLAYLAEQKTLSTNFFDKQNRILKHIIEYYQSTQTYTEQLEKASLEYRQVKQNQIRKYEDLVVSFEAICIIHGITDFPMWVSKGKDLLLYEAEQLGRNKQMRLPSLLNEKIEVFPKHEKRIVLNILQKDINAEIEKLLKKINWEKRHKSNATRIQRDKTKS